MYILKTEDGKLVPAPANFSPDTSLGKDLDNIVEVYVVSKTLVKQVKLVVKDKAEVAAIRGAKIQAANKK